jgi:alkaline phosphatase D
LSRRQFLKSFGFGSAAFGAAPFLPGCDSSDEVGSGGLPGASVEFKHGVASGDPLADRVILWTRLTPSVEGPVSGSYVMALDPALSQRAASGSFTTDAARDYTVKVDAAGLTPGTSYYYRFDVGSTHSPVGRTRTLPTGGVEHLRIAVVSCASLAHGLFNAYRRVAERGDLDAVVHLGDYIYDYGTGQYGTARAYEPDGETITLADYRLRYAQYRRDADLMEFHRQHAIIPIWDDHETADNSWRDGAVNHDAGEGDWNERVRQALQAFYEWMPTREVDPAQPRKNYRSFRFGELAELTMLEERLLAREEQIPGLLNLAGTEIGLVPIGEVENNDRELIGAEQEAWLAETLRTTPAKWKLIGQGVMFGQFKLVGLPEIIEVLPQLSLSGVYINSDQWDGYPDARERVFDILTGGDGGAAVGNVVVLTGDIHTSWAMDLTPDPNNLLVYNPLTGDGSVAVEFVATSITSPGLDTFGPFQPLIPILNPHMKYVDLTRKGYLLLDITPERLVGEHWYIDTIATASDNEALGAAFQTADGANRLTSAGQTEPKENPPLPAP